MEIKILKPGYAGNFEPTIVSWSQPTGLVGEVVYSQEEFDKVINWLEDLGVEYVSGPLGKAISLTNIATVGELASKLTTN